MSTSPAPMALPSPYDLEAYDYELPPALIAQAPAASREQARLLVLERRTGVRRHLSIADLPAVLRPGDLLVVNDTRVVPARLRGRTETGAAIELLVVRPGEGGTWHCLGRPAKRLKPGRRLDLGGGAAATVASQDDGRVEIAFAPGTDVAALLQARGELPLPPYIERIPAPDATDAERYQTVYARVPGAVAAPTAGLHFTPGLLERLAAGGVETASLTLHVGPGTFQPVRCGDVRRHRMEAEWAEIPAPTAAAIARARAEGRRVVAVGTTTTRALESRAGGDGVTAGAGWAEGYILHGHRFRVVDALLTNFHLPRSTLLMLVAAFAGREEILDLYREAVERGYRFYSYGDATLLL